MLTKLRESQRVKAHCYWPSEGQIQEYGSVVVHGKIIKTLDNFVIRKFSISSNEKQRSVYQIQYLNWPDFGVPSSSDSILELIDCIENYTEKLRVKTSKKRAFILIHCSAGIGRCGTLFSIYSIIRQLKEGTPINTISVSEIVSNFRTQRIGMVQTKEQYTFIYQVINDYLRAVANSNRKELRQASVPALKRKPRSLRKVCGSVTPKKQPSIGNW